jgi:hypothetical protein
VAFIVVRNQLAQAVNHDRAFGPRADETHLAAQHVDELRQLVQVKPPQISAGGRDTGIIGQSPLRTGIRLGIFPHGTELKHFERLPAHPDAPLAVKNGSCRLEPNRSSNGQHERGR